MFQSISEAGLAGETLSGILSGLPPTFHLEFLIKGDLAVIFVWILVITVAIAIGIPSTIVAASIGSGAVFGPWIGTSLVAVGTLLGSIVSFALTRKYAGDWVASRFPRRLAGAQAGFARGGIWYLVAARLLGIPFIVVNVCFSMTKITYTSFAVGTLVGSLPVIAAYSGAGAALRSPSPLILVAVPGCALALILLRQLARRYAPA